jgi:hypothetical protein
MDPTQADSDQDEWLRDMLNTWQESRRSFLCFPFADIFPKYLVGNIARGESFWLYMYYTRL